MILLPHASLRCCRSSFLISLSHSHSPFSTQFSIFIAPSGVWAINLGAREAGRTLGAQMLLRIKSILCRCNTTTIDRWSKRSWFFVSFKLWIRVACFSFFLCVGLELLWKLQRLRLPPKNGSELFPPTSLTLLSPSSVSVMLPQAVATV